MRRNTALENAPNGKYCRVQSIPVLLPIVAVLLSQWQYGVYTIYTNTDDKNTTRCSLYVLIFSTIKNIPEGGYWKCIGNN